MISFMDIRSLEKTGRDDHGAECEGDWLAQIVGTAGVPRDSKLVTADGDDWIDCKHGECL